MKFFSLLIVGCILYSSSTYSQRQITVYDPIVLKAKETSLYTENVNWENVNSKFIALTKDKDKVADLKEGLQYLINSLGDKHAAFRSTRDHSILVSYTGESKIKEAALPIDSEFYNTVINNPKAVFSYALLENQIGYLNIVGIGPGDVKAQADANREGLNTLKEKGVDKWIVDFRFNGGGNMEPMISGLAPLIGEGFIGGAINVHDEIKPFEIRNGAFFNYNRLVCKMNAQPKIAASEKVTVLVSRYTASSGEMTAITFKGRENTLFIGEPSAGYTTGNGYDVVTEELALVISQDIFIDRNKVAYTHNVSVDESIPFQHHVEKNDDLQIQRAIAWLTE
jgi:C-terminal processing protease CtpA/Prc